ncbi:hypothetical protein WMY93_011859 [Mugilogobius chulae]|uniref:Uncharacterized protein n=1 Tax=Mugilogobius chulae TaxID=88201 RepID=A0AAW0P9X3_9GOBI
MLGKKFSSVHSGDHLSDKHRERKEDVLKEYSNDIRKKENGNSTMDLDFTLHELKRALEGTRNSAPGEPAKFVENRYYFAFPKARTIAEFEEELRREKEKKSKQPCLPHHDTTAPMSHLSQDISLSITLTNTAPNTDSAISMVQLEARVVTKEHGPPTFKFPAHMNIVPVQSCPTPDCRVQMSSLSPADVQMSSLSPAGVQMSSPSNAGVQMSSPSNAGVQMSSLSPAGVQMFWLSPAVVQMSLPSPAGVQMSSLSPAGVQMFWLSPTVVQMSSPSPAGVQMSSLSPGLGLNQIKEEPEEQSIKQEEEQLPV